MAGPFKWVPMHISQLPHGFPPNAVVAGHDLDGSTMYVGRAHYDGDTMAVKVLPSKAAAYIAHGGQEILMDHFEVMVPVSMTWLYGGHGSVPPNAVATGTTNDGELLYIGRVAHDGCLTVGKIHPTHGRCYYPFNGQEQSADEYECLVIE